MNRLNRFLLSTLPLFALTFLPLPSNADSVVFKNGHVLDGIIERETSSIVVLNIGVGTTTIRKTQIDRVIRSENTDEIRNHWKRNHFYRPNYVPSGFEELAEEFRQVLELRNMALKANLRKDAYSDMAAATDKKIAAHKAALEDARAEMRDGKEVLPKTEFDALVKRIADLEQKIADVRETRKEHVESVDDTQNRIAKYKKARGSLNTSYNNRKNDGDYCSGERVS